MDIKDPVEYTPEVLKIMFEGISKIHPASEYTQIDKNTYIVKIEGLAEYKVEFTDPYKVTLHSKNDWLPDEPIQGVMYDINQLIKEIIIKVL